MPRIWLLWKGWFGLLTYSRYPTLHTNCYAAYKVEHDYVFNWLITYNKNKRTKAKIFQVSNGKQACSVTAWATLPRVSLSAFRITETSIVCTPPTATRCFHLDSVCSTVEYACFTARLHRVDPCLTGCIMSWLVCVHKTLIAIISNNWQEHEKLNFCVIPTTPNLNELTCDLRASLLTLKPLAIIFLFTVPML